MNELTVRKHEFLHSNNNYADRPAFWRWLFSDFDIHSQECIITDLVTLISKLFLLVPVAMQAGLNLTWSETQKIGFRTIGLTSQAYFNLSIF